jgi:(1->4)-alpha-D-glucan 1-alpha-D-glucosylmutase
MNPPRATYRLQLHGGFTMFDAAGLVDYLARLGISHLYCSPILQAVPGSTHGYDGVDPQQFDRERGGEEGFEALAQACEHAGLGIVVDIVPNHLAISSVQNKWWQDVLQFGRDSTYAMYFDIDWEAGGGALVLPVLGETLEEAIRANRLRVERAGDTAYVAYFDQLFPLSPATDAVLLHDAHASPNALMQLLEQQHYRLCHWREDAQLNYRRFFDIATLAGVCVERPEVFDAVHARVLELVHRGRVEGLRIDHPDGLRDPRGYFAQLAERAGDTWIVAEKILATDERLRDDWAIAGTTGYDFLSEVLAVLIEPEAAVALSSLYMELTDSTATCADVVFDAAAQVSTRLFSGELRRLVTIAQRIGERDVRLKHSLESLSAAIAVFAACMPVYRTYIVPERGEIADEDVAVVHQALARAKARRGELPSELFDAIADLLLLATRAPDDIRAGADKDEFVARFQQFTAPITAKGEEDTAFYRFNRFVALNEVGGEPARFGCDVDMFHAAMRYRAEHWPASMLTTSTHDTKRSEDVRARLAVLSEIPEVWAVGVREWMERNRSLRAEGATVIDAETEYMLYQNLVGAWPIDADRMVAYMHKATREAKQQTSWREPDQAYEQLIESFVRSLLDDGAFTASVTSFVDRVRTPGRIKSLAQTLLRCVCPGVPDLYQGCELWDLSLVDPDNRRPVDFALRRKLFDSLGSASIAAVWNALDDTDDAGLPKLWTIMRALEIRRATPEAFGADSGYAPLKVIGEQADRALGFARTDARGQARVCAVVPIRTTAVSEWRDTAVTLPLISGGWQNAITRESVGSSSVRLAALFHAAPIALLTGDAT